MILGIVSNVASGDVSEPSKPLTGVHVIDLTSNVAGPFASTVLADLGADVVHVEGPKGDDCRRMAPSIDGSSAYFTVVNRGKRGMTLDIGSPDDRVILDSLIAHADVFVTNLRPGKLDRLRLNANVLCEANPRLIHASLSAYGRSGAERDKPGYDAVLQARTGIAAVTGESEGAPVRAGVSVLDVGAGTWLALGVLAALYRREVTGRGGAVSTSLFETGASWVSYHVAAHQISGEPSKRSGSGHPAFAPYGIFSTKAGEICIGVGGDHLFHDLCDALGRPDLASDPRFVTNNDRTRNADVLRIELENALATRSAQEWASDLGSRGLPVDAVNQPEDLLSDPLSMETSVLQVTTGPAGQEIRIPGLPLQFDGTHPSFDRPAPH